MMEKNYSGFIWVPRIILIAYIIFLMLFSFDVFGMKAGVFEKIGGFLVHSAPSIVMAALLGIFWNRPFVSAWVFIGATVFVTIFFNTYIRAESFLMISLPPLLSGVLFLFAKRNGRFKRAA